ncbi:hypothetical protein bcgnr5390_12150 [Bacillus luti]|nr:hypothetical protein BC2903_50830 [Bacillus cereus]
MENYKLRSAYDRGYKESMKRFHNAMMIGETEIEFEMIKRMIEELKMSDERIVIITDYPIFDVQRVREAITNENMVHMDCTDIEEEEWESVTYIVDHIKNEIVENMIIRMITKLGLPDGDIKIISGKSEEDIQMIRRRIKERRVKYVKDDREKWLWDFLSSINSSYADGWVNARKKNAMDYLKLSELGVEVDENQAALITGFTVEEIQMIREEMNQDEN